MIDIDKYNPISNGVYRVGQKESIKSLVDAFDANCKVMTLYGPTSSGKTLILSSFGNILVKEYGVSRIMFTSPQVSLITSGNLFGLPKLVGRANYPCLGIDGCTADDCPFTEKDDGYAVCVNCPYRKAKRVFGGADFAATTYARFNIDPRIIESTKGVLIDESTNLFDELIKSASLEVPKYFLKSSDIKNSLMEHKKTIEKEMLVQKSICKASRDQAKKNPHDSNGMKKFKKIRAEYRRLVRNLDACDRAIHYVDIGVPHVITNDVETRINKVTHKKEKVSRAHFKILDAREPFKEMVNRLEVIVLASGTPTTELIADPGTYREIVAPHPIDKLRRMIYYTPVGSMAQGKREATIPAMAYKIAELHNMYNCLTIVHCGSYEIAVAMYDKIDSRVNVICQDQEDRNESLSQWQKEDDCVFLSVAMEQGLDLKGPKYPLNIIMKINFPYLGSDWVNSRNKLDNWKWYRKTAAVNTIQACGRTTRSPDDYSEIYILDSSFEGLYKKNKTLFPDWFKESLVGVEI